MSNTTSEALISTCTTRGGSLVEVVQITVERVTCLDEVAAGSGPLWRCHGCGDGSDRPLSSPLLGDPARIVQAAAAGHAEICRR